jgi:hypothetical protein
MRSYQVFAAMSPERATEVMHAIAEAAPVMFASALQLAGATLKTRPSYLQRQPFDRRAAAIRRALARVAANSIAEETLAVYFTECRKELLLEWLELLGVKHEDGILSDEAPPAPAEDELRKTTERFLGTDDDADRELLLRAFAAQESIDWPILEAVLDAKP